MAEHCDFSDLPVTSCALACCRNRAVEHRPVDSAPFIARYDGTCAGCGFAVVAGVDRVRYRRDRLVHDDHRRCKP